MEYSDAARNYCGKLLGAVLALLVLRAAGANLDLPSPLVVLYCDNRGVLSHGNNPLPSLSQKQKQADLIRLIKFLSGTNNGKVGWEWVEGHAVESRGWMCCTLPERLNDQADGLA